MTFDDRASALASTFTLTPRQARFLTLVALISGYCLRRQYGRYAGIALGKNPAAFLDQLVARGLATRHRPRRHRSFVYHVRHRAVYDALGLDDNRNRRPTLPTRQARRLMLLDFALAHPHVTWYATEADKVDLFTRLNIPRRILPGRLYRSAQSPEATTLRQFVFKLPIYRHADDPVVHFTYLGLDTTGQGLTTFLIQHAPLLHRLPAWRVTVVHPTFLRSALPAWHTAIRRLHFLDAPTLSSIDAQELHAYFRVHHALSADSPDASPLTIDHAYEQRRRRFATSPYHALYPHWCALDGPRRPPHEPPDFTAWRPAGAIATFELSPSYDLYGSYPGIA